MKHLKILGHGLSVLIVLILIWAGLIVIVGSIKLVLAYPIFWVLPFLAVSYLLGFLLRKD